PGSSGRDHDAILAIAGGTAAAAAAGARRRHWTLATTLGCRGAALLRQQRDHGDECRRSPGRDPRYPRTARRRGGRISADGGETLADRLRQGRQAADDEDDPGGGGRRSPPGRAPRRRL